MGLGRIRGAGALGDGGFGRVLAGLGGFWFGGLRVLVIFGLLVWRVLVCFVGLAGCRFWFVGLAGFWLWLVGLAGFGWLIWRVLVGWFGGVLRVKGFGLLVC